MLVQAEPNKERVKAGEEKGMLGKVLKSYVHMFCEIFADIFRISLRELGGGDGDAAAYGETQGLPNRCL